MQNDPSRQINSEFYLPVSEFDSEFADGGILLDFDSMRSNHPYLLQLVEQNLLSLRRGIGHFRIDPCVEIKFCLSGGAQSPAYVTIVKGRYVIGMSTEAIDGLWEVAQGVTTFPGLRESLGWLDNPENINAVAILTFLQALSFIIYHELTHVAHGHLAVLEMIREGVRVEIPHDEVLTRRTLEYDADAGALEIYLFDWFDRRSKGMPTQDYGSVDLCRAVVGPLVACKFLEGLKKPRALNDQDLYEPGAYRTLNMLEVFSKVLASRLTREGAVEELSKEIAERVVLPIESYMETLYKARTPFIELIVAGRPLWETSKRQLEARWARIRPQMQAAKLCQRNLAPATVDPA